MNVQIAHHAVQLLQMSRCYTAYAVSLLSYTVRSSRDLDSGDQSAIVASLVDFSAGTATRRREVLAGIRLAFLRHTEYGPYDLVWRIRH